MYFGDSGHRELDGADAVAVARAAAEGLLGAKAGSTRQLIVPSWLGYGKVAHGTIPANSILVFSVQILSAQ